MGDPVDRVFDGLSSGMEGEVQVFGRTVMKQAREDLYADMNENLELRGLPPIEEPEYPGSPTAGGSIVKNVWGLFGGQGQEPDPFSVGYTLPVLKSTLKEKGGYTEKEATEYINRLSFYQLMALRHRYPRAYVSDPRTSIEDPEDEALARRIYLGIDEPMEGEKLTPGDVYVPPSVLLAAEEAGEKIAVPHAPKGFHNVPPGTFAIGPQGERHWNPREDELPTSNYYDTWQDRDPTTGQYPLVHGTESQMLTMMKKDPGRYLRQETQIHQRQGELLHPTVLKGIEEKTVQLMDLRDQLKNIEHNFDPNWLTLGGKIQGKLLELGSWLGALNNQQRFELFARASGIAAIAKVTNDMIRMMTGAQMSKNEADRLMIQEINRGDVPDVMIAKLMRSSYFNSLALVRNRLVLEKGVLDAEKLTAAAGWEKHVTIEASRQEMLKRAQSMYEQMGVDTDEVLSDYEARERMRGQFQEEYGMDPMMLRDEWVAENLGEDTIGQMQSLGAEGPGIAEPPPEVQ